MHHDIAQLVARKIINDIFVRPVFRQVWNQADSGLQGTIEDEIIETIQDYFELKEK